MEQKEKNISVPAGRDHRWFPIVIGIPIGLVIGCAAGYILSYAAVVTLILIGVIMFHCYFVGLEEKSQNLLYDGLFIWFVLGYVIGSFTAMICFHAPYILHPVWPEVRRTFFRI